MVCLFVGSDVCCSFCCALYRFIDRSNIKDVILNEGVSVFRVVYYMAFIVDGRDKLDVAFQVNKESDTQTFCSKSDLKDK